MINIILNKNENRAIALDKNVKIGECVYEENNNIINIVLGLKVIIKDKVLLKD